jgi:hypothetical protein
VEDINMVAKVYIDTSVVKNKEKRFDCIKMKSSTQAKVYAETYNMSKEELLSYFNKNTQRCQSQVDLSKDGAVRQTGM